MACGNKQNDLGLTNLKWNFQDSLILKKFNLCSYHKTTARVQDKPVEAGEGRLVTQVADQFDFLLIFQAHRSAERDVLELTLRLPYLQSEEIR